MSTQYQAWIGETPDEAIQRAYVLTQLESGLRYAIAGICAENFDLAIAAITAIDVAIKQLANPDIVQVAASGCNCRVIAEVIAGENGGH